jgi:hypothetical protein
VTDVPGEYTSIGAGDIGVAPSTIGYYTSPGSFTGAQTFAKDPFTGAIAFTVSFDQPAPATRVRFLGMHHPSRRGRMSH